MSKNPKFSVLVPTRNRSFVVHHAIKSVLGQTVRDLELIVSDNSSDDQTARVVKQFDDPRLRYFRTERVLGMPDNFENALSKSRGEWITLMPDDCVLSSRGLEIVETALRSHPAKLVVWDWWHFYPSTAEDPARRTQYVRRPFGGGISYEYSRETLRNLFRMTHGRTLPKPYQSCAHRSLIDALRARVGRAYPPPAPDYTFLTGILALTERYAFVDLPMMLSNAGDTTPHASPEAFKRFLSELDSANKGGWLPIKIPEIHPGTILMESVCRMQAEMPELAEYELDIPNFLVDFRRQLAMYDEQKYPVENERSRYEEFVARQPLSTRIKVNLGYAKLVARERAKRHAKRVIFRAPLFERLAAIASKKQIVRGEQAGFEDILGAMRHLEQSFSQVAPATA